MSGGCVIRSTHASRLHACSCVVDLCTKCGALCCARCAVVTRSVALRRGGPTAQTCKPLSSFAATTRQRRTQRRRFRWRSSCLAVLETAAATRACLVALEGRHHKSRRPHGLGHLLQKPEHDGPGSARELCATCSSAAAGVLPSKRTLSAGTYLSVKKFREVHACCTITPRDRTAAFPLGAPAPTPRRFIPAGAHRVFSGAWAAVDATRRPAPALSAARRVSYFTCGSRARAAAAVHLGGAFRGQAGI